VRIVVAVGLSLLGVAVGVASLVVARSDPGYSIAGDSGLARAALLGAGWALIAVGVLSWLRRSGSRFGLLLAAAGFAWFAPEWNNPGVGSAAAFTLGLCLSAACPALAAHAVLAFPAGRLASTVERVLVVSAYVGSVLVLGLAPTLFLDPQAHGCNECPRNLVVVADRAELADDIMGAGVYAGVVWSLALASLIAARLATATRGARRARGGVLVAGGTYLALVAITFAVSLDRGSVSTGTLEHRLWFGEAAALLGVAAAVAWGWLRVRRARQSVTRLVVDLAASPPPGGLRDALAAIVGDPTLTVAYAVGPNGRRLVDPSGRQVELPADREETTLLRDGRPVAVLSHATGVLGDTQLVEEVSAAGRLALENERLQAEIRAQVEELRASRVRVVEAVDRERKQLERNLHDGAQQRLVGLSLSLRLLRSRFPDDGALREAEIELHEGIRELRELAHGIFPAVLADDGFAAAVEALAEEARVPIRIRALPGERFPALVETVAYAVVAEAADAARAPLAVRALRSRGALVVEVEADAFDAGIDVVGLEDRVGALGGSFVLDSAEGTGVNLRAELPCES
jgi:signal transduction histidine kinase